MNSEQIIIVLLVIIILLFVIPMILPPPKPVRKESEETNVQPTVSYYIPYWNWGTQDYYYDDYPYYYDIPWYRRPYYWHRCFWGNCDGYYGGGGGGGHHHHHHWDRPDNKPNPPRPEPPRPEPPRPNPIIPKPNPIAPSVPIHIPPSGGSIGVQPPSPPSLPSGGPVGGGGHIGGGSVGGGGNVGGGKSHFTNIEDKYVRLDVDDNISDSIDKKLVKGDDAILTLNAEPQIENMDSVVSKSIELNNVIQTET